MCLKVLLSMKMVTFRGCLLNLVWDVSGIWSEDNAGEKCVPGGCCDGKNWKNTKARLH